MSSAGTSPHPAAGSPGTSTHLQATEPDTNRIHRRSHNIEGDEKYSSENGPQPAIRSSEPTATAIGQEEKFGADGNADETVDESDTVPGDEEFKEGGYGW